MLSFFFFRQKTAYELRISDWSSDVCSSDLVIQYALFDRDAIEAPAVTDAQVADHFKPNAARHAASQTRRFAQVIAPDRKTADAIAPKARGGSPRAVAAQSVRSEEHTSELKTPMRISYAVFG